MSREVSFRYNLLRGGAYYARLRAMETPTIRMQRTDRIKMALTGVFAPAAEDVDGNAVEINWLSDEIQPEMIIDGTAWQLGVFIPTTPRASDSGTVQSISIEAYDRCQRVLDTNSAGMIYWESGTEYLDCITQLLGAAGILTVFASPSAAVLPEDREWPAGTAYLDIINELLGEIGYEELWFDGAGSAILKPISVPEASELSHRLDASDPGTRVLPGISRETDVFSAPNVFIVSCANPDKSGVMTASASNENPQSPLSVQRRGRQIVHFESVDNIASQSELQAYAERLRNESMISGESVRVSTGLLPGWGVADVVGLHYGELTAICIEQGFEMQLQAGGTMTHELRKVVYNLE